jgi:hypothetical protein
VICHQKLSCNPDLAGSGCRPEGSTPASKLAGDPGLERTQADRILCNI